MARPLNVDKLDKVVFIPAEDNADVIADGTSKILMTPAERTKLSNIEANATADQILSEVVSLAFDDISAVQGQAALQEVAAKRLKLVGGTMTGPIVLSGNAVSALQPVTKQQFDAAISGQGLFKDPVRIVSQEANLVLSGLQTIDTITLVDGDRILVKDQTDPVDNGAYDAHSGSWTRSLDSDGNPDQEVRAGTTYLVLEGANGTNRKYTQNANGSASGGAIDVGVDAQNYVFTGGEIPVASGSNDGLMSASDFTKLAGIDPGADVTNSTNVNAAGAIMETDLPSNHSIIATQGTGGSPAEVEVAADTMVGRLSGENIKDLSPAEIRTLINVEDDADVTDSTNVNAAGAIMESDMSSAHSILVADAIGTPLSKAVDEQEIVGRATGGAITGLTGSQVKDIIKSNLVSFTRIILAGDVFQGYVLLPEEPATPESVSARETGGGAQENKDNGASSYEFQMNGTNKDRAFIRNVSGHTLLSELIVAGDEIVFTYQK